MTELPRGTITTVFTDIEGSTALLRKLGKEGYREELELHRALLREAFTKYGGHEVGVEGDSFHFVFTSAAAAVVAAAEAQRALAEADWPCGEPIRVRVGIHTGEPAPADDLYIGLDIHRAARVMSAAHGGQVLLSETTALLIREELPPELALRDLGNHHLKDFVAAERLYQLGGDEFPPLRTAESPATETTDGRRGGSVIEALRGRRVGVALVAGLFIASLALVTAIVGFATSSTPALSRQISIEPQTQWGAVSGHELAVSGKDVRFTGTVPSRKAGVRVVLQASHFPFQRFSDVSRAKTSAGGSYALRATIPVATRYRVVSGDAKSRTVLIYATTTAFPQIPYDPTGGKRKSMDVTFWVHYPAAVAGQEAGKPVYVYSGVRDKRGGWPMHYRLKLQGTLRQHLANGCDFWGGRSMACFTGPGPPATGYTEMPYVFTFRVPASGSRPANAVAVCVKDTEAVDGFGLPGHHHCGDPFIRDRDPRAFPNVGYLG